MSVNHVIAVRGKLLPYQITACDDLKSPLYILLKMSFLVSSLIVCFFKTLNF